jgi:hypothetical protein
VSLQEAATQKTEKGDDFTRSLERLKSTSAAARREAGDQLAESGYPRDVTPRIALLKDTEP